VRKGKHASKRISSASFQERVSIWLAKRHLTGRYHSVPSGELDGSDWHALARIHVSMHRSGVKVSIEHCCWTPAFAHPILSLILIYSLLTLIGPIELVPPIGVIAILAGWLTTGSVVIGLMWALAGSLLVGVILFVYWVIEATRLMFVPPTAQRFEVWIDRYVVGWDEEDGYAGWGAFTYLWPGGRRGESSRVNPWGAYPCPPL